MPVGDPSGRLLQSLDRFFTERVPIGPESGLLVAFSAGPDSTALLWALERLRRERGFRLEAAHVDHALDPHSAERARRARRTCDELEVPLAVTERPVAASSIRARGLEAAARAVRYDALERTRRDRQASYVATGHHRDDQIETVLLRLLQGSGWQGLAGIPAHNRHLVRPLLEVGRAELRAALAASGLEPARDPTNLDLGRPRNRLRHQLLPYLEGLEPELGAVCLRLAGAAAGARRRVEGRLARALGPQPSPAGAAVGLRALERLPAALLPAAAALLHRAAGADYPPSRTAVAELARQLGRGGRIGGDCGDGWRWQAEGDRLELARPRAGASRFTYTLEVPGEVELAEVSLRLKIGRASVAAWMFEGSPTRTALGPALRAGDAVVVRNRRPGDRLRPLGCGYSRRLKEVLIDRRVPRAERDRIPLLCVGGKIAWVPGVTIDEAFRVGEERQAWVAQLEPA